MASKNEQRPAKIDISKDMRRRYRECAPAALKRRTPAYLRGQFYAMVQWFVIGCIGLMGLYVWRWSAVGLLILFLAGLYSGLFADLLKWLLFRRRLEALYEQLNNDRLVWAMVVAERKGESQVSADVVRSVNPGQAVLLDLFVGSFAGMLFYFGLKHLNVDLLVALQQEAGIRWALLTVTALPWFGLLEVIVQQQRPGHADDTMAFQSGGRGVSLFLVVIVFMIFADSPSAVHKMMVFLNVGTVLIALLAGFGLKLMTDERHFLAAKLAAEAGKKAA